MRDLWLVWMVALGSLCALLGVPQEDGPTRLWERHGIGYAFEFYGFPAADFSEEVIEPFIRTRLRELGNDRFVVLRIYRGSKMSGPPPVSSAWTYGVWLYDRSMYEGTEPVFAEAVSRQAGSVLRLPNVIGAGRKVLRGTDPLMLENEGWRAEILYIGGLRSPDSFPRYPIYVRTSNELTRKLGHAISSEILSWWPDSLGMKFLIRNDTWFAGEGWSFPYVYPFEHQGTPPTPSEWKETWAVRCAYGANGFSCL